MATKQTDIVISANGVSDAILLSQHQNKVYVFFNVGVTGTLIARTGPTEAKQIPLKIPDGDTILTSITQSIVFSLDGPGLLTFDVSSLTGGNVEVSIGETF